MGCVKSKRSESSEEKANSAEQSDGEAKGRVNPVLLEYAQRLSEEIVSRAVQQWADIDSRYSDIPYIECDVP
ncbi:unnamed protein product [Arctogadus glacialis]